MTVWNYNPRRGWLDNQRHADGRGPDYERRPSGKLRQRTWARETSPGSGVRVATSYGYNAAGDLESVSYNDSTTPNLKYGYDRRGRLSTVTQSSPLDPQSSAAASLVYHHAEQLARESWSSGPLAGVAVANEYDAFLRRTNYSILRASFPALAATACAYDSVSRLQMVSQVSSLQPGPVSATYAYQAHSPLVKQITFQQGDTTRLVSTRQYDYANRLLSVSAAPSDSPALNCEYSYDEADQPTRVMFADCSYWRYEYDRLGQLRSGRKYLERQQTRARPAI